MSWSEFWFVLVGCVAAMWACRVIPLFLLKGRELPPRLAQALGFIPPAAFAALVAAVAAALVAVKSRSLLWTAVAGVGVYAALAFFAG